MAVLYHVYMVQVYIAMTIKNNIYFAVLTQTQLKRSIVYRESVSALFLWWMRFVCLFCYTRCYVSNVSNTVDDACGTLIFEPYKELNRFLLLKKSQLCSDKTLQLQRETMSFCVKHSLRLMSGEHTACYPAFKLRWK